jgi:hypothetical protein
MAYSIYGYVKFYDENTNQCITVPNASVYPYFYKVDSDSSDPKWADPPYVTEPTGYYSFSLEDDNFLGINASYKRGKDRVFIAIVWNTNDNTDQDRNSLTFTHCLFFDHLLTQNDSNEVNLDILLKRKPVIDTYSLPSDELLTKHTYTMSETRHIDTSWVSGICYPENSVSQKYIYSLVPIFDGHQLINTLYYWGEIAPREVNNNSSDSYIFQTAGIYEVCIEVREKWNTSTKVCKNVTVRYNEPVPDFHWSPTYTNIWEGVRIKGQEEISFYNDTTDLDGRSQTVYTYKWIIEDSYIDGTDNTQVYDNVDINFVPTHKFQSPGTKNITLIVHWNDGFQDLDVSITKQIEIFPFNIIPDFYWTPSIVENRGQEVIFIPNCFGDIDKILDYSWVIEDNYPAPDSIHYTFSEDESSLFGEGSPDNTQYVDNTYIFNNITTNPTVHFHSNEPKTIELTVKYWDGWQYVTKLIEKTLYPSTYDLTPQILASTLSPLGRETTVSFKNNTPDSLGLQYYNSWTINDFYMACNLDNPNPGEVTDNSEFFDKIPVDTIIYHNFQNTDSNEVKLEIWYDDGWQRKYETVSVNVTPIVYDLPVPDFYWTPEVPISRDILVTFFDNTSDPNNRVRALTWYINDQYNLYNPDNPNYGTNITENNSKFIRVEKSFTPTHYFQDNVPEEITLIYYYDDGFCEQQVQKIKTITFTEYTVTPDFTTDPLPNNEYSNGWVGKIPITYINTTDDPNNRQLDIFYQINDVTFPNYLDNIISSPIILPTETYEYTFQYPSRKPFNSIDHDTQQNINKSVKLTVRIDNGWSDQIFYDVTKNFEATPRDIKVITILYDCNVDNYSH